MSAQFHLHFLRLSRTALWLLLTPISLLAGCSLYQPPIYPRLELPPEPRPLHILFVGNSLTYYNDLPGLLQQFSAREPRPAYVESVTAPFASLAFHWKNTSARKRIARGGWDCVVLQEFSTYPVDHPAATLEDFRRFSELTVATGAQPIIFENWTRRRRERDAPALAATYSQVTHELLGIPAPIGLAWQLCRTSHADIRLWRDDRHPTVAGTYLAACVLYRTLYHKPALGLPTSLPGLKLPAPTAATLQQIADQTPFPVAQGQ